MPIGHNVTAFEKYFQLCCRFTNNFTTGYAVWEASLHNSEGITADVPLLSVRKNHLSNLIMQQSFNQ